MLYNIFELKLRFFIFSFMSKKFTQLQANYRMNCQQILFQLFQGWKKNRSYFYLFINLFYFSFVYFYNHALIKII